MDEEAQLKNLIAMISKGNQEAFSQLYQQFTPRLYSYLRLQVARDSDIQDLMQDIFIAIWKSAHQYNNQSTVATWIFGITRHKLLDWLRSKQKYSPYEMAWQDDLNDTLSTNEEDFTNLVANQQVITEALTDIPGQYSELIYLVFIESMNYKEISLLLNIPEGTIKSRMHQAKIHLRKKLVEGGMDNGQPMQ